MVYVFYQLCSHSTSRQYVRDETEATPYLLDLLHDRNPEVQRVCDATLQMIGDNHTLIMIPSSRAMDIIFVLY